MLRSFPSLLAFALLALPAAAEEVRGRPDEVPVETGTLEVEGSTSPIAFHDSLLGPMVTLAPVAARLGGELQVGPLGYSHALTVGPETYRFGPESSALTVGEEIRELSRAPAASAAGLLVPLDLLRLTFGEQLGWEFSWEAAARRLRVFRRPSREIAVSADLVHLQGVSTLVFQFPTEPRYRVERGPGEVRILLLGDSLRPERGRALPTDPLVRAVSFGEQEIRVRLAEGTVAEDYTLERPFRLVFDIFRGSPQVPTTAPAPLLPSPPRRGSGVRTIVLDPGHGGSDTGAKGASGILEKDLTLELARILRGRLLARLPVKVVLTRNEDADLPLDTRAALANQQKGDLFVSLHLNSSPDRGAQGAETFFSSLEATDEAAARAAAAENLSDGGGGDEGDPLYDLQLILWDLAQSHHLAESRRLASLIQDELNLAMGLRNRGVKQAPFRVLMGAAMPAILVEVGFLSNSAEEARLQDPAYQQQLVNALTEAIARYKAQVETSEPATLRTEEP